MIITLITILCILLLVKSIYSNDIKQINDKDLIELESYLDKVGKGDGTEDSSFIKVEKSVSKLWAQLGAAYLLKPSTYNTKAKALHCYSQAITIVNDEDYTKLLDDNDKNDINEVDEDDAIRIRYEYIISWSLQKGILLSSLGRGLDAITVYDDMLLYIQIVDKSKFNKSKNFSIDKSAVLRLKAEVLMKSLNDPLNASKLFNESVTINPCELDVYRLYILSLKETELIGNDIDWLSIMQSLIQLSTELLDEEYQVDEACLKDGELLSSLDSFAVKKTSSPSSPQFADTTFMARSSIYWAIYEAADKANDTRSAWEYLQIARSLDLETYGELSTYSVENSKNEAKAIAAVFTKDHWPDVSYGIGSTSKTPVFIVGFLRSGIKLLESLLLSSHPNITSIGSSNVLFKDVAKMHDDMTKATKSLDKNKKNDLQKMMTSSKSIIENTSKRILKKMKSKAKKMRPMNNETVSNITRIMDRTLSNYRNIARIHLIFPNAIILHVTRDPLDTLLSCYTNNFESTDTIWTLDMDTLIVEYSLYLEIIQHYRNVLPRKGIMIDVSYEALVTAPEAVMKDIITKKLQLKWVTYY